MGLVFQRVADLVAEGVAGGRVEQVLPAVNPEALTQPEPFVLLLGGGLAGSDDEFVRHTDGADGGLGGEANDGGALVGLELLDGVSEHLILSDQRVVIAELHPADVAAHGRQVPALGQAEQLGGGASRLDGQHGVRDVHAENGGILDALIDHGVRHLRQEHPEGCRPDAGVVVLLAGELVMAASELALIDLPAVEVRVDDIAEAQLEELPRELMDAGHADADAVGAVHLGLVEAVHQVDPD